jgi:hypothetical protein
MTPLSVICWKWFTHGYRTEFDSSHVNALREMVARHFARPHRFICVTNDTHGLSTQVEALSLPVDFADVQSPHGVDHPSCYRRLRAFAPDADDLFGPRFVSLDLDLVLVNDVTPLWDRSEDFVIWADGSPGTVYNGSMFLLTAGARRQVWDRFDPLTSPQQARAAGCRGSDQGWVSYCLGPREATWGRQDGCYSYKWHVAPNGRRLPTNARVVNFHGVQKAWHPHVQAQAPWLASAGVHA